MNTQASDAQGIANDLVGGTLEDTVKQYADGLMG